MDLFPQEMASEERKAQDEKLAAENLFKAQGAKPVLAETDQFKCGKCGQRKCSYYQLQVRISSRFFSPTKRSGLPWC
jgi:transcription elongation factor S-II